MNDKKSKIESTIQLTHKEWTVTQKSLWLRKNRGALATVARSLDVTASMVSLVFWGKAVSARVDKAIAAYILEIELENLNRQSAA